MKKRRFLSLIWVLLFVISATGCGQEEPDLSAEIVQEMEQQAAEAEVQWDVVHTPLPDRYEVAAMDEQSVYAGGFDGEHMVLNVCTKDTAELTGSYKLPNAVELKSISVSGTGEICVFGGTEKGEALWKVSPDGQVSTVEDIVVEELGLFPALKNFYVDSNGFYYLWYQMSVPCAEVYEDGEEDIYTALDRIYVKDRQMNTILYEQVPDSNFNKLVSLIFDEMGTPMLLAQDEEGYYVQQVRTSEKESYEPKRIEAVDLYALAYSEILAFTAEGLLYVKEGALHLYDIDAGQDKKLLELAGVGILEEDIIYLGMHGKAIEILDNYRGFSQSEYTRIVPGESERLQLSLGVMELDPEVKTRVAAYNRYQNQVTIFPKVYAVNGDFEGGFERLKLDVIKGKAPDLICVSGLDADVLGSAGAFADLYTFMQKDEDLRAEDLVPAVLQVYEQEGHLYTLAPAFSIYTMWGADSVVDGRSGVDVEEMMQLLGNNGGDINSIYGFSADESVLTTLCAFNMDKFIDWGAGTCDFATEAFHQVVDFAKEYKGMPFDSLYTSIQNKELLLTLGLIQSVEDYHLQSELYGEEIGFIGYPTTKGSGVAAFFTGAELAISKQSKHPQEAWDFLKYWVKNGYNHFGFPLLQEQLEMVLENSLVPDLSENEEGKQEKVAKGRYKEQNIVDIIIYQCEPEDVEAVRKLINSVSDKFRYHTEIQKIIDEEIAPYMQGQKSFDEACTILQSRVQLYLDERY